MSRVAVVTGGNKGIGFAIVKGLCEKFYGVVYLTARSVERGEAAVEKLKKAGLQPRFHQLDVTDDSSIQTFKKYLEDTHGGLDILINNAAIVFKIMRANYFGLLAVSKALFPLLRPHARVVQLSSSVGHLSHITKDDLKSRLANSELTEEELNEIVNEYVAATKAGTHEALGWPQSAYFASKVVVTALSRIQQEAFDADDRDDLVVNSVHPGYVNTDLTSHKGPLTIERGARAPIFLALLPKNTNIKGQYVWHDNTIVDWVNGPMPGPY